jgi:hypothetical protein
MTTKVKKNQMKFKGKTVNTGIDIHKLFWRITALIEGDIVLAVTLARPAYDSFKRLLAQLHGTPPSGIPTKRKPSVVSRHRDPFFTYAPVERDRECPYQKDGN